MKNATSLSSVYRGDNITGKEVKTAIIFSPCMIHVHDWQICKPCKLKYYKAHNLTSERCIVPLLGGVHNTEHLSSQTIKYFKGKGNDCVSNTYIHSARCMHVHFPILWYWKIFDYLILSTRLDLKPLRFILTKAPECTNLLHFSKNEPKYGSTDSLCSKSQDTTHDWDMC